MNIGNSGEESEEEREDIMRKTDLNLGGVEREKERKREKTNQT